MDRIFNFSAGPSMLPVEVLEEAAKELANYHGCGMSVMELSHRSLEFEKIIGDAEAGLRELMEIPENYKVLFLQGGASLQFSMIPMNLFRNSNKADFLITGMWAKKAAAEAKKFGKVNVVASSEDTMFSYIPKFDSTNFSKDADYFHITTNNTIYGSRIPTLPDTGDVPLVADMSSNILSEVYDVSKFGLIYAGAQKNIGPAGLTVVIIRDDLVGFAKEGTPPMLDYKIQVDNGSMYNTPPTFAIYMAKLVFDHMRKLGGIPAMQKINEDKAKLLYDAIDNSKLFSCPVNKEDRSIMNVVFVTGNEVIDKQFIKEAESLGLVNLGGHRSVGGMRASIYNAMPVAGVKALIKFMQDFEVRNNV
ncbi:MAG: 3-phosphoserine/phosphohydroxythreonine transaminase [Eubacteriales bacterium]